MARCDGNNCLYNAQRGGQKNLLAGLPCAGPFLASTGVTSWDKTEWAPAKPGAAWPAATWHGIQGEPWLCCAMGLPSACPASTAWTVAKHSRQDTMVPGALRHNDQCHTAVTPLGQGMPGPGCGNGDKGQCSCTEPAATTTGHHLPARAGSWIRPHATGCYFTLFVWVSDLFDSKPATTQPQTYR